METEEELKVELKLLLAEYATKLKVMHRLEFKSEHSGRKLLTKKLLAKERCWEVSGRIWELFDSIIVLPKSSNGSVVLKNGNKLLRLKVRLQ